MRTSGAALLALAVLAVAVARAAQGQPAPSTAAIHGTVTAITGTIQLPGALVTITPEAAAEPMHVAAGAEGKYEVAGLAPGVVTITVALDGFHGFSGRLLLAPGADLLVDVNLELAGVAEEVDVVLRTQDVALATTLGAKETLDGGILQRSAVTDDTLQGALATLPGVVLTPHGLSIRGGRPTQSAVQIGTAAVTDPSTGMAALRLPVDAVSSVDVLPSPHAVEFGRFSSGITLINTRKGSERWNVTVNNLDPGFRTERGHPLKILGISSFAPRLGLGGPLFGDRLRVAGSFQYRYTSSEVRSRPQDENRLQQYLSGLVRVDTTISPGQSVSLVASAFPERRTSVNLDTFTPPETTFDQRQRVHTAGLTHSATLTSTSVLDSTLHWSHYDVQVSPKGSDPMRISPESLSGSHFTEQGGETEGLQWTESLSVYRKGRFGEHLLKAGLDLLGVRFAGTSRSRSIEIVRADSTLAREVRFSGFSGYRVETTDLALFVQDRWQPASSFILEVGARVDRDGVLERTNFTPRGGAAWSFGPGRTFVLRGGAGLFHERPPSSVRAFEEFEQRVVTTLGPDGTSLAGPPVHFVHRADGRLETPYAFTWNVDLLQQVTPSVSWRVGHLRRRGRHDLIVDALNEGAAGTLLLSSGGRSRYDETEVSLTWVPSRETEVRASYVHAVAEGDLNAFSSIFGANGDPLVRPNEYGPLPGDVRHRLVMRGRARPRGAWFIEAVLDWRSGFPYSALDERQDFALPRNRAGRFPSTAVFDYAIERRIRFLPWRPWLGFRMSNAFNSFAPWDVQQNLASPSFGGFFNSRPRRVGLIVRFER